LFPFYNLFSSSIFGKTLFFLEYFLVSLSSLWLISKLVSFSIFFFPPFDISYFIFFKVFVCLIKGETPLQWSLCHVFIFYLLSFHLQLLQQCVLFIAIAKPKPFTITPFLHLFLLLQKCICFCVLVHNGDFANCSG